ncbi:sensor domain-containing diguanylate cyclase [Undibacterium luofuense]|uniref:diguanylate cyclase n=1 Tax=Undibacterium luofuense TaxID=2828733 RepID=A0A941I777_9BURK|nr:diguanylate cyclase [Undibacterium luofuense]MBR7782589.1 diguanylate cyclase [Undibacterium luofuense]
MHTQILQIQNFDSKISRKSLVSLTSLFVIFVCISILGIDAWRSWSARAIQLREAEIATANMSKAIAQHADDTIKSAEITISGIVERVERDGVNKRSLERLHLVFQSRVEELPQIKGLFVFDKNGNWLVTSLSNPPLNLNNSDRGYFIYHRDNHNDSTYIGDPIQSRSSGSWVITVSRRINNPDGSFAGVVLATLDINYFNRFYDSFNIGENGAIVLVLNRGIMLTRRPVLADSIGKNMLTTTVFKESSVNPKGTFVVKSAQDGVVRLNGFQRLSKYPLFVSVALSKDEVLKEWLNDTYLHLVTVAMLISVLAAFGYYVVKQMKLRLSAEVEMLRSQAALQALNQTLERLSLQDGLTELANRRNFDITLEEEFSRAIRNSTSLALVMIDVDHFKQYNDLYGHAQGDVCLKKISAAIKSCQSRAGDLAARYGGEELAVILPTTDIDGAVAVAEKFRLAIKNLGLLHSGNEAGIVTVSAGVQAMIPIKDLNSPSELIRAADQALYAAKHSGRDQVCAATRPT